jgi:hypothetical protein
MKMLIPVLLALATTVAAQQRMQLQQNDPHLGYIYPAGAQRGTTTTIVVGGQYLEKVDGIHVSGGGVRAKVVGFERPLNQREVQQMRNKLDEVRTEIGMAEGERPTGMQGMRTLLDSAEKAGISLEDLNKMREQGRARNDPKIQENAQLAEKVTLEIEVLPNAEPGRRELRLFSEGRLSAPLAFHIGGYAEHREADGENVGQALPVVLNGQILPGDSDRFSFQAGKGGQLVVASAARELIPHLADAVPGWFQATMALYDATGRELAYADDYLFNPDPVLYYEIPDDGMYTLEIKDALYRGREDFVYRITLGEIPFITSIFPLGGKSGTTTTVEIQGQNLLANQGNIGDQNVIATVKGTPVAYPVPFAHGTLPELLEAEPNNSATHAMAIRSACVINGRINEPGDRDVFEVAARKGETIVAEIQARRLNSPLDSVLKITDAQGNQLAFNDDHEDKSRGLQTHHADSRIAFAVPRSGIYHVHLGDAQNRGGPEFAYRLHLGPPDPGYELRVVPSYLNGLPGASVPFKVYALRKDGFDGEIKLELKNKINGLRLDGARIPAGQDQIQLTITLPPRPLYVPEPLAIEGRAVIDGKPVVRPAVPAEDMMQAFIYHHLVPTDELLLSNIERSLFQRAPAKCKTKDVLKLQPGNTTTLAFEAPTAFGRMPIDFQVELGNAPSGVEIEDVAIQQGTIEIALKTAAATTEKGLEGNLLFELFIERERPRRADQPDSAPQTIRIPAGYLPAVPFKVSG